MNPSPVTTISDEQLWQRSRDGDREAFGGIVARYQSLVCGIAYSACGNLSRSEDLAQETFLTAWQRLDEVREPARLRGWLCGIVRNLALHAARRDRRGGGPTETLEDVAEPAAAEADPAAQAISEDEARLLWKTLGEMPAVYREPLILFYRQGRSVMEVAAALEISEDSVRQRLSRGRLMLRDELTNWVESTLDRTTPDSRFTTMVLIALPVVSSSLTTAAVTAGAGAGGSLGTLGKGLLGQLGLGVWVGPLIGLGCAWLGIRAAASKARSPAEHAYLVRSSLWIVVYCVVMSLGLAVVLAQAGHWYAPSAIWMVVGVSLWTAALVGGILWFCRRTDRHVLRIRTETGTLDEDQAGVLDGEGAARSRPHYFETRTRFLGLPLFAASCGGFSSDAHSARPVVAWVAVGDVAVSPLLAAGGLAIAPLALGALTVGVISLSLWGVAVGVMALGSLAFGGWAVGCVAAGWKGAIGFAAIANDYALGLAASAREANTPAAREWFRSQGWEEWLAFLVGPAHLWLAGIVGLAVALRWWTHRRSAVGKP